VSLRLSDFDFALPERLIARYPARPRDAARLLRVGPSLLEDRLIRELPEILRPGDLMVFNDTKVIPAQLAGRRIRAGASEVAVEVTLHKRVAPDRWQAFAKPGRKLAVGDRLSFGADLVAEVLAKAPEGDILVEFDRGGAALMAALGRLGAPPLPPYIRKLRPVEARDKEDYQTVYAGPEGAVAAPTAGLHFTPETLSRCQSAGAAIARVTLHVELGTFQPLHNDTIEENVLHSERYSITSETWSRIESAKRVLAVGTTSVRTIESAACAGKLSGDTQLFIYPGAKFHKVGAMLTNFHLPRTSLLILVCAFSGKDFALAAYRHAVEQRYRFFSYGDCVLII